MRDDDVVAVGQRPVLAPQRFPGLTTHNHRMGDGQLLEMLHILGTVPRHATIEADGTGATFLVTGFGPDKIHREGLGIIVTPVFFSGRQPGRSGLGFVIAATATVMLHFAYSSWIAELGLSVVDSEDSGAVTFTVFAVHETVISIRPQQVP